MANTPVVVMDDTLTDIADAIRAKTGGSATMTPSEMPTEIASIPSGGGQPGVETGSIAISSQSSPLVIPHNIGSTPTFFGLQYASASGSGILEARVNYSFTCSSSTGTQVSSIVDASATLGATVVTNYDSINDGTNYITMDGESITITVDGLSKIGSAQLGKTATWIVIA